ncbi:hypothetical protein EDD22DRAFT_887426, partial [Suillus occidentalis]
TRLPSLVTPRSVVPGHGHTKRMRYAILEWNPLLDSSNMEMDDKDVEHSHLLIEE